MKSEKIIFFDLETNGLPKNYRLPCTVVDNWPRITEIAFLVVDRVEGEIFEHVALIKPDGWTIPDEPFFKRQGFTTDKSKKEGTPILNSLQLFIEWVNESDVLVAHNMTFDYNVMGAEMIRKNIKAEKKLQKICTMQEMTSVLKLPHASGGNGYKWPKLEELYRFLFEADFVGAHSAIWDLRATAECFFEMEKRGYINIK